MDIKPKVLKFWKEDMFWNLKTKEAEVLHIKIQSKSSSWIFLPQALWVNNKIFIFNMV